MVDNLPAGKLKLAGIFLPSHLIVNHMKLTLAHITHEAVEKIGGIGTVLEGLMTSPIYQEQVQRSILVGPTSARTEIDPEKRLGEHGTVLYSSVDDIDTLNLGAKLRPIEWAFDVAFVYGKRTYDIPGDNRTGEADVLLIDVFHYNKDRLSAFKHKLSKTIGIDSLRYEAHWDYEEYIRLAEPAFYALNTLLDEEELPCMLFAHEFMGLPTAFKAILEGSSNFRTIFHAHECATARHLVETHTGGHDLTFYNAMTLARENNQYVTDIFGDLSSKFRHALISQAHLCDGVIAVGDDTAREMHFLGEHFDHHKIDLVYNGVPAMKVTQDQREHSRDLLAIYAESLTGSRPDVLMTHVMRPVISKGLWRDIQVCHHLDQHYATTGQTGVLFILTTAGGTRRPQDILRMENEYGWPRYHREHYPDLVGPEVDYYNMAEDFNNSHENIKIILVNQFGWEQNLIGQRLPEEMNIAHFRCAADIEFGMATYEPFGISPLEPLCAGAICVISAVCGCAGFVNEVTENKTTPNVIIADYTKLDHERSIEQLLNMTQAERDPIEMDVSRQVAQQLIETLPNTKEDRLTFLNEGQRLANLMGWDEVSENHLIPMLRRVLEETAVPCS